MIFSALISLMVNLLLAWRSSIAFLLLTLTSCSSMYRNVVLKTDCSNQYVEGVLDCFAGTFLEKHEETKCCVDDASILGFIIQH